MNQPRPIDGVELPRPFDHVELPLRNDVDHRVHLGNWPFIIIERIVTPSATAKGTQSVQIVPAPALLATVHR